MNIVQDIEMMLKMSSDIRWNWYVDKQRIIKNNPALLKNVVERPDQYIQEYDGDTRYFDKQYLAYLDYLDDIAIVSFCMVFPQFLVDYYSMHFGKYFSIPDVQAILDHQSLYEIYLDQIFDEAHWFVVFVRSNDVIILSTYGGVCSVTCRSLTYKEFISAWNDGIINQDLNVYYDLFDIPLSGRWHQNKYPGIIEPVARVISIEKEQV